ncbi:glycosyltransferase [Flavobacterium sp. TBRC 19031]|uniref:glycosyltransferase n=1 Tax=Flavobacterium mekongense TaxID=3379707 RepID=UPI00399A32A6
MKILRVINSLDIGGAERSIAGNVPLHIQNGFDMDVLLLNGKETFFQSELKNKGIKVFSLGQNNNIYNPILVFKLMKFIRQYDVVHAHLFPTIYWVAFAKMFSFSSVKLVFTEHDTHNRRRHNFLLRLVDKIVYRQFSTIITISNAAAHNLATHLGFNHTMTTIYNGIDLNKVRAEATIVNPDLQKLFLHKKPLVQIAGFRDQKDQDTVIKALTVLPQEFIAVFVGEGKRMETCKALAEELKVADRVFFMGLQSQVGSIIGLAEFVVMSSHWEGFGRAAVEGMALRKPVLASNVSGLADVVSGAGLLFEVGDYQSLADSILQLSSNKQYYDEVAAKCYDRAEIYDIKHMVQAYEKVYNQLR